LIKRRPGGEHIHKSKLACIMMQQWLLG